jgi:hypothetical protein
VLVRAARRLGTGPFVALVGAARGRRRSLDLQVDSLARAGLVATVVEPEQLPHGPSLGLRQFAVPGTPGVDLGLVMGAVRPALTAGYRRVSSQTAEQIANRKVLAWVSAGRPWMTAAERATVERYLPWTRVVTDGPVPELLQRDQDRFVLKPAVGTGGDGVLLGRDCDPGRWRQAVADAVATGDHVAQEFVEPTPVRMEFAEPGGSGSFEADVRPVLSPFLFDGRDGGCLVRVPAPGQEGAGASVALLRR